MLHLSSTAKCFAFAGGNAPDFFLASCCPIAGVLPFEVTQLKWMQWLWEAAKGNVRNRILQAAEEGKAILKSCLEWLMLLSCTNELLFLHLCTKKPILICLWLQEYNFLVIVRNMLSNTGNRNSILTTNGKGIKPVMWWIPQKYPQWCLAMENCISWICFSYKKMGLKYISFIHKGYFAVQHFYKIYSLKNYDLS